MDEGFDMHAGDQGKPFKALNLALVGRDLAFVLSFSHSLETCSRDAHTRPTDHVRPRLPEGRNFVVI